MSSTAQRRVHDEVVSFDSEQLILVDSDDNIIGYENKAACHQGDGILHRAFSLFIFNADGDVLLQQRSDDKPLWGGYWSNSCCSHPRQGEVMDQAAVRRLSEELGLGAEIRYLYKFQYQAPFGDKGAEHELCSVYIGYSEEAVVANPTEVKAWRWISPEALSAELAEHPERFTPWFKMEWAELMEKYRGEIGALG